MNYYYGKIIEKYPKYYFIFSGEGLPTKYSELKKVKYYGILNENDYFHTLIKAEFIFLPLSEAPGTKIKTLQSLSLNKIILGSKHALKGINIKKEDKVFLFKKREEALNLINKILNNKKKIKSKKIKTRKVFL